MTAKQKKFITSYEILGDIEKACESTGITKRTFYNWSKSNEEFKNSISMDVKTQNSFREKRDIKKEFTIQYKESLNIAMSCDEVGISRGTFYNWIKNDEEFKFSIGAINEGLIDLAESVIGTAMAETNSEGKPTKKAVDTARFILSQRGIKRGWGEKIQTEIIMTPWDKAQEAKKRAKEVVIDVTAEEINEALQKRISDYKAIGTEERKKYDAKEEKARVECMSTEERKEHERIKLLSADEMQDEFLARVRDK